MSTINSLVSLTRRQIVIGVGVAGAWTILAPAPARAARIPASLLSDLREGAPTRRFYRLRNGRPAWSPPLIEELFANLEDAERHAIDTTSLLKGLRSSASGMARDVAATRAALAYARALSRGIVDPTSIYSIYGLARNEIDLVAELNAALPGRLTEWLGSLPPQDEEYRRLGQAYIIEAKLAAQARPAIASGPVIRPGESDARVPAIAAALGLAPEADAPATLTPALVSALEDRQRAFGIADDGVVGPDTILALNFGAAQRARSLALNLERRRWLSRAPASTRIDVNIAAATLSYVRNGSVEHTTRVVVGRPEHETPNLEETFDRLVVNPPWNVPRSIARREIAPRGRAYMRRNHMRWRRGRIVQSPGPWAALGQVKFDMRNRYAIYLHDTPSKSLFDRPERYLSHGCVRVEHAVDFARRLADERGKADAFDQALASGKTRIVSLGEAITVRLLYHCAYWEGETIQYRLDPYGRDETLARALGLPAEPPHRNHPGIPVPLGP